MRNMFFAARQFNGDLGRWNVENVQDMSGMFYGQDSSIETTSVNGM
jgi:surface protein